MNNKTVPCKKRLRSKYNNDVVIVDINDKKKCGCQQPIKKKRKFNFNVIDTNKNKIHINNNNNLNYSHSNNNFINPHNETKSDYHLYQNILYPSLLDVNNKDLIITNNIKNNSKTNRSKTLKNTIQTDCVQLLKYIQQKKYYKLLCANISQYKEKKYKISKNQFINLSIIANKLKNKDYINPYQYAKDMRHIYQFELFYNFNIKERYNAAIQFCTEFEVQFYEKIIQKYETNTFIKKISYVVLQLIINDNSIPFRMPINNKQYHGKIKHPMDLGSILNAINLYCQFDKFMKHLILIFTNCFQYFSSKFKIYNMANELMITMFIHVYDICPTV